MLPNLLKGIQEKVQESIKKTGQLSTGSGKLKCNVCGSKKVIAEIKRSSRLPCYIFFNDVLKFDYPECSALFSPFYSLHKRSHMGIIYYSKDLESPIISTVTDMRSQTESTDYPKYVGIVTCNKCKSVRIIG